MEQKEDKVADEDLSHEEYQRYGRQLIMPAIGLEGQRKLKNAKVLMIGAGGLGSPAALYLSGAGIGTLGLVDADVVEESNLHRQVIHTESRVGVNKTVSAKEQISQLNRFTNVITIQERLTSENVDAIIGSADYKWDIVMDGSDNAATRYLINDACCKYDKPLVSGSALQWEGQITVLNFEGGPCYRCLHPKPPPAVAVTSCSDGGVLGMVPGLIGQLQAIEIVKIVLGQPKENLLWRRMIFVDTLSMRFRNIKLRERNPQCVACGPECPAEQKVQPDKFDYADFCQTKCDRYALMKIPDENSITCQKFNEILQDMPKAASGISLIDLRPPVQFNIVNTNASKSISEKLTAINIDFNDVERFTRNFDKQENDEKSEQIRKIFSESKTVFMVCRRGKASKEATELLLKVSDQALNGFKNIVNVEGGIEQISKDIDPALPLY